MLVKIHAAHGGQDTTIEIDGVKIGSCREFTVHQTVENLPKVTLVLVPEFVELEVDDPILEVKGHDEYCELFHTVAKVPSACTKCYKLV